VQLEARLAARPGSTRSLQLDLVGRYTKLVESENHFFKLCQFVRYTARNYSLSVIRQAGMYCVAEFLHNILLA
jgi:hypothetical protein